MKATTKWSMCLFTMSLLVMVPLPVLAQTQNPPEQQATGYPVNASRATLISAESQRLKAHDNVKTQQEDLDRKWSEGRITPERYDLATKFYGLKALEADANYGQAWIADADTQKRKNAVSRARIGQEQNNLTNSVNLSIDKQKK